LALEPEDIDALAAAPQRVKTDAGEIEERKAADAIALDQYSAAKAAAAKKGFGLRFRRHNFPGAVSLPNNQGAT
jgi:hypothetical protein